MALNDPVNAGGVALYQLVVTNNGPSDAQNVVVTDTLPVSTTYAGGDAACSASGQTVTCNVGTLAAGASRTLLVQAQVASSGGGRVDADECRHGDEPDSDDASDGRRDLDGAPADGRAGGFEHRQDGSGRL